MATTLDERVEATKKVLQERREAAEVALQEFFDMTAKEAEVWMSERVRKIVTDDHETTTKLGTERLGVLKAELSKLVADAPRVVRGWIDRREVWAHRVDYRPDPNGNSSDDHYRVTFYEKGPPDHSRAMPWPLRKVFGEAPQEFMRHFVAKYGYLQARHSYFPQMVWTSELTSAVNAYATSYEAFKKAKEDYGKASDAMGKHNASDLWDKV